MSDQFIGEIRIFAGNFAPQGWALCEGQILSIAQNQALFAILGTTYGGNGQTTFALPDLRGRYPMQSGQGPGLSPRALGEQGGVETVTLISTQMPAHTHSLNVSSQDGDTETPVGTVLAADTEATATNYRSAPIDGTMNPMAIGIAGGSQPHQNMCPFLVLNFIIALEGVFPSRG
ncbi:phage tail collar domain-containing protein [Myxococcus stipitatus DSM 14675]|uniref:Phage tail collar domain-containing protein n=1 Tax=Myxococcus stipitatus (strain DSM 14675 / JCM 12634 / Mx s8) TaxID=1278073 RepID=L7TYS8_MYXSD|nr:phage tail collar domain-containing protein [Myxococcus stipitatus DSM 14675]